MDGTCTNQPSIEDSVMKTLGLTITNEVFETMRASLLATAPEEGAGYLLCKEYSCFEPWRKEKARRFIATEFIPVNPEDVVCRSHTSITWRTNSFVQALKEAENKGCKLAIVHSHPNGPADFSVQDDSNEGMLWSICRNRRGRSVEFLSIVLTGDSKIRGRVVRGKDVFDDIELIKVIGNSYLIDYPGRGEGTQDDIFDRQIRLLGKEFTEDMRALRWGIVGCGGTGSPLAHMLARQGAGHILLIDKDKLDRTSSHRVHLTTIKDAMAGAYKAAVLAREIKRIGLKTQLAMVQEWVNATDAFEALKSCDIIFGCTDDNHGRIIINRFAYFYMTPVFDMGLKIKPSKNKPGSFDAFDGRVTVVQPGTACLVCRGVVNPMRATEEQLQRNQPEEYQRRKKEAYIIGGGDPNPVVVNYTTETACMALNELVNRLKPLRIDEVNPDQITRKFDRLSGDQYRGEDNSECRICGHQDFWGLADVIPALYLTA